VDWKSDRHIGSSFYLTNIVFQPIDPLYVKTIADAWHTPIGIVAGRFNNTGVIK
jgi:hypothetical protein